MFVLTTDDVRELSEDRLEEEITELAAHLNAATCRWLCLIGEFDRREAWTEWVGLNSTAHWLSWRCALGPAAAHEHVRVARCMRELPKVRETFGRGELSYSQVRALTRIATPESEDHLVMLAEHATAAQLEVIVRAYRGVLEYALADEDPDYRRRFVDYRHDLDGSFLLTARLPAEEGAIVMAALEAGRDAVREAAREAASEDSSAETTQNGDNADALLLMADTLIANGPSERTGGDRHQVVVHVDVSALTGEDDEGGACHIEHGPGLHPETARRLACDASIVRILEQDGRPLSVGRKTRSLPPALRRALRSRDAGCRFPGCTQRRFLHAHHLDHWAHGGRTDLSNLIHLCSHHHRLVHEGGCRIERRARGELCFRRPDGAVIPPVPRRKRGDAMRLAGHNGRRGLAIAPETCLTKGRDERFELAWVVDGIVQYDPRLRE